MEKITDNVYEGGIVWQAMPVCQTLNLNLGSVQPVENISWVPRWNDDNPIHTSPSRNKANLRYEISMIILWTA